MEFSVGGFKVEIKVKYVGVDPRRMSKRAKRRLAKRVMTKAYYPSSKIDRIRGLRQIAIDEGWNIGLLSAKNWVEEVFADNGAGEIAL